MITNKQYKSYDRVSRYSPFPIYYEQDDNKYFHGITAHLDNENTPFVAHVVKDGETLDSIALYYYNNPTYYWVLADFNRISDPFAPLVYKSVLRVPTFSAIKYDMEMR